MNSRSKDYKAISETILYKYLSAQIINISETILYKYLSAQIINISETILKP